MTPKKKSFFRNRTKVQIFKQKNIKAKKKKKNTRGNGDYKGEKFIALAR